MPYLDESGLSIYDSNLKEWISSQESKTITSSIYPWTKTAKAGAVSCYPVGGTELKPVVDFLFTETPPASGDKGPTNPSTISGVSEVKVTHGNKNYVSLPYHTSSVTREHVTWTINADGSVSAVGTASPNSNFYFTGHETTNLRLVPNRKYFLHGCPSGGSANTFRLVVTCGAGSSYSNAYDYGNGSVFIPKTHDANVIVAAQIFSGYSANLVFKPQLEDGETGTVFDVVSRNVYTIPLGSTFYGGTLDLATGLMTVTVGATVLNENYYFGTSSGYLIEYSNFYAIIFYPGHRPYGTGGNIPSTFASNKLPIEYKSGNAVPTQNSLLLASNSRSMKLCLSKSELSLGDGESITTVRAAMLQWLSTHPITVVCPLENASTVQLTPTSISALAQTDKYTPRLNTIYTDAQAVQVGYVKSPIREEYELQQAIVSQGGNI